MFAQEFLVNNLSEKTSEVAQIKIKDFFIRELFPDFNQEEKTHVFPLNNLLSRKVSNSLFDFTRKTFRGNC